MRACPKCGVEQSQEQFQLRDGRRVGWCLSCKSAYKRAKREADKTASGCLPKIDSEGCKLCPHCKVYHPANHYQHYKGRPNGWCMSCRREAGEEGRRVKGVEPRRLSVIMGDKKSCMDCGEMKDLSEFDPTSRGKGGVKAYCKSCNMKRYYDKDVWRERTMRYRKNNRERHLALHRVRMFERRMRIKVAKDGTVTDEFLRGLYDTESCFYCHKLTPRANRTADHKVSLAAGGAHSAANLVMACHSCNSSKRDLSAEVFMEKMRNDNS